MKKPGVTKTPQTKTRRKNNGEQHPADTTRRNETRRTKQTANEALRTNPSEQKDAKKQTPISTPSPTSLDASAGN